MNIGLNFYVYCVDESIVENTLYKHAFETGISHLYKELGWNGGTIHQIKDEIIKRKKEMSNNTTQEANQ